MAEGMTPSQGQPDAPSSQAGTDGGAAPVAVPPPAQSRAEQGASVGVGSVASRIVTNLLIGLPFLAVGGYGLAEGELSELAALGVLLVGGLVVLVGVYVSVLSRPRLNLMQGEQTLALRHPSMRPAFARMVMGLPFLAAAGYMLEFTTVPYVYPFIPFLIATYLYFRGIITYWMNHHTTYYVTNRRAVQMYRFIWLDTTEIPVAAINSISETRSFIEMVSGRGSVLVASGIGARHKVRIQEIDNPGPVAEILRQLMP